MKAKLTNSKTKHKAPAVKSAKKGQEAEPDPGRLGSAGVRKKLSKKTYEKELARLQIELVKLQEWIRAQGLKVVVIFEGRDAAGKAEPSSASPRV